jgi:hypothetical protein
MMHFERYLYYSIDILGINGVYDYGISERGNMTSNTPVPLNAGRPTMIFPEGVVKLSKSPWRVASDKKATVVSYDALSSGEL